VIWLKEYELVFERGLSTAQDLAYVRESASERRWEEA
jgi:hypothetical protein